MTANTDSLQGGLNDAEESIDDLIDKELEQLEASQAATEKLGNYNSALSQTMGLASTTVSNLQEFNLVNEKQAETFRKTQAAIELMLVPMELYLIVQELQQAAAMADITAKAGQTGATTAVTASTWSFNAALYANPIGIIVLAIILLIVAFVALEKKFGLITKSVDMFNEALFGMDRFLSRIMGTIRGIIGGLDDISAALLDNPLTKAMIKGGSMLS